MRVSHVNIESSKDYVDALKQGVLSVLESFEVWEQFLRQERA